MARSGITYEQFAAAADELLANNETITINSVRAKLGTGSPNTIHRFLVEWREKHRPAKQNSAPRLSDDLMNAIAREFEQNAARSRAESESAIVELQTSLDQLSGHFAEAEEKADALELDNQTLSEQVQKLTAIAVERAEKLEKMTVDLKTERENGEDTRLKLAQALNKIELFEKENIQLKNANEAVEQKLDETNKLKIIAEQSCAVLTAQLDAEKQKTLDLKERTSDLANELKQEKEDKKQDIASREEQFKLQKTESEKALADARKFFTEQQQQIRTQQQQIAELQQKLLEKEQLLALQHNQPEQP